MGDSLLCAMSKKFVPGLSEVMFNASEHKAFRHETMQLG